MDQPNDKSNRMVWLDAEMTGLDPSNDKLLEIAIIITDKKLNEVARGPVWTIRQSRSVLYKMSEWCKRTHGRSGLIKRCIKSTKTESDIENEIIEFLSEYVTKGTAPLCGNSIHQDRAFLHKYMNRVLNYLHYQVVDVTSFRIMSSNLGLKLGYKKSYTHRALHDVEESINQMRFYIDNWLAKQSDNQD